MPARVPPPGEAQGKCPPPGVGKAYRKGIAMNTIVPNQILRMMMCSNLHINWPASTAPFARAYRRAKPAAVTIGKSNARSANHTVASAAMAIEPPTSATRR